MPDDCEPYEDGIPARQEYEWVRADSLEPHPENPNKGREPVIEESIVRNGFYGAVIVQRSRRRILAGEHRWRAAQGVWRGVGALLAALSGAEPAALEIPVIFVDVDDPTAKRILLVDNRSARVGYDDEEQLATLLKSLEGDYVGTGYEEEDVDALLRRLVATGDLPTDPYEEWVGMPGFEQDAIRAAATTVIHFPTEKDAADFFLLIGRNKARSLWWPQDDGHVGSDVHKAYVSAEDGE